MQNIKYQLFWNGGMQNAKIFRVMFSFIQNAEFLPHKSLLRIILDSFAS